MPTNRIPLQRQQGVAITERAIELYRTMKNCRCTCRPEPADDVDELEYVDDCPGCRRWWIAQCALHRELRAKPWEWPLLLPPTKEEDTDGVMRRMRAPDARMVELEQRLKQASRARLMSSTAAVVELPTST